jgi:hypothetical protein
MRLRVLLPLAAAVVLVACSSASQNEPTKPDLVRSREDAIVIASSTWAELKLPDRPLRAGLDAGKWIVQRVWRVGDPTEEAVIIDAKTGRAERSSTEVMVTNLNRR